MLNQIPLLRIVQLLKNYRSLLIDYIETYRSEITCTETIYLFWRILTAIVLFTISLLLLTISNNSTENNDTINNTLVNKSLLAARSKDYYYYYTIIDISPKGFQNLFTTI